MTPVAFRKIWIVASRLPRPGLDVPSSAHSSAVFPCDDSLPEEGIRSPVQQVLHEAGAVKLGGPGEEISARNPLSIEHFVRNQRKLLQRFRVTHCSEVQRAYSIGFEG